MVFLNKPNKRVILHPIFCLTIMTLIKSISGIRGTIGGTPGNNLTPLDVVKFTSAFIQMLNIENPGKLLKIIVGRDARISGEMVNNLVTGTLMGMGVNVVDAGLSTTPSIEMAVTETKANGGIILTASHNPKQWNALKLLNDKGEFISSEQGNLILELAEKANFNYCNVDKIGTLKKDDTFIDKHISKILELKLVDVEAIKKAGFKIAVDAVNSTGGIAIPQLLTALGVEKIELINCEPNGIFLHNPEPLPEHLKDIAELVSKSNSNLGFAVDPDVDRLAIIDENGEMFGEEYTLVAIADYILKNKVGNTVSNLSSTRALRDITEKAGGNYFASAVGEVNVVEMMKQVKAIIGGEGNGGIIYPELHYGRDALVGIALFLTHLAKSKKSCSQLRSTYPNYIISKNKIELPDSVDLDSVLQKLQQRYSNHPVITIDGVKIEFENDWVHLRKSNTEPIIRIYAESDMLSKADHLANKLIDDIREIIKEQ